MKNPVTLLYLMIALSFSIITSSCDKNKDTGRNVKGMAEFSVSLNNQSAARSGSSDSVMIAYQLMISIADQYGNPVMTDRLIPLHAFGTGFISEKVEIEAGKFELTGFLVIDPAGRVVFAAPVEGSPLAYITNDPLPLSFTVTPDQVTSIAPEVIATGNYTPGDFGYASFGMQIIKPLEFYAICYLDNPLLMAPSMMTGAKLTISSKDGWSNIFFLKPEVNHLIIRGGSESYLFVLEKEGYRSQTFQFSAGELLAATEENPLVLKIPWGTESKVLELQPGPEQGNDAMISNLQPDKNFGDYKYFEATFLTEPVLTVMRSNRSLISFTFDSLPQSAVIQKVTLVLTYDIPVPFDSTFATNTDPSSGAIVYGAVLQQIIEPWDEHKVTWNNQPKTIEMNQVFISPFIRNSNVIQVDVTKLFANPAASPLPFYGLMFRSWPEDKFPGFRFASSDYPVASMRPKLIIYYTVQGSPAQPSGSPGV
jgi:hypothetical protein